MTIYTTINSPVGDLTLSAVAGRLTGLLFEDNRYPPDREGWRRDDADSALRAACAQLEEYFAGRRKGFQLPMNSKGTEFQQKVWAALLEIPFGETRSYGEQARLIGDHKAVRAVGLANGRNPIPIIVPCHRVIGADGSMTGFGGGIERKKWLLAHEARFRSKTLFD
ncbi:methylated-DNA--[protein]-cysteine S-methyltransferase [Stagnimonas aquatica]|uniref:Methylated-DNA--protein-cysteine methyltransferase n=1 Tax=Stagnimonas aquatica TaxID=2689987 RepID=A0A3N0V0G5_9GAMM|nr:methylated-DNA--[protein]-cysteine S-methyltransferase [Stagnimonas aquatica]ROH85968.1 methylated-DNA--[protein]-cysteine S-methyltransferase [Stagnimonas aquatica]